MPRPSSTAVQPWPRSSYDIAADTNGVVKPSFSLQLRPVTGLLRGDVVAEPVLGEVRVMYVAEFGYDEMRHEPLCQVHWVSDDGLSTAARTFPASTVVAVRAPTREDTAAIRHGVQLAARHRREIDAHTARLIAAHLQRGPGSALYAFAVYLEVGDRLYQELDEVLPGRWPEVSSWVNALANHCLNRTDHRRGVHRGSVRRTS